MDLSVLSPFTLRQTTSSHADARADHSILHYISKTRIALMADMLENICNIASSDAKNVLYISRHFTLTFIMKRKQSIYKMSVPWIVDRQRVRGSVHGHAMNTVQDIK
jgi:hypothetical protein